MLLPTEFSSAILQSAFLHTHTISLSRGSAQCSVTHESALTQDAGKAMVPFALPIINLSNQTCFVTKLQK